MVDPMEAALVVGGLADAAYLYSRVVIHRTRERRLQERLRETAHLSFVVRATLADRRAAAFAQS
jgi:hypothetical protein